MKLGLMKVVSKYIGFILIMSLLGVIYIANAHQAERKMRKIERLKKSVADAKSQCQVVKSDMTYKSTESQLAKRLKSQGLKKNSQPPIVINSQRG